MKKLTRPKYLVALTEAPDVTIEVEVTPGDRFRAELEAGKWRLPGLEDAPQLNVALWVYCALTRLKLYAGDWPTFKNTDLYHWEGVADANGDQLETPVDPTEEGSSPSASSSPTGSPESSTGSTPTSGDSPPASTPTGS